MGKSLNKGKLNNLEIELPSIDIQNSIASTLNTIYSLISKRQRSIELLDEYTKSTFLEIFVDNTNAKRWENKTLSHFIEKANYGTSLKPNEEKKGIPVLRMNNITYKGYIDLISLKWADIKIDNDNRETHIVKPRDILFNRTNSRDLVGKTAIWELDEGYTYAGYLIKIRLKEKSLNPYYVWGFLNSSIGKDILYSKGQASGNMVNISLSLLKTFVLPIPPIKLQIEFEEAVKSTIFVKNYKEQALVLLIELFQSLQYNLFNSQDERKDEIDLLIEDELKVENLLYSIENDKDKLLQQYELEKDLLFKVLERTEQRNKEDKDFLKGLVLKLDKEKIAIRTNKDDKFSLE